ncbi:COG3904 family protein [Roseicella frigidaeris]|uniref:GYF domain-containing protein n=1 Tax=Roseicella frigidaeris TaxID=2230885 RepID=A0A327MBB2_9PROT|nr:GYF domain-containing protein [Roseicella frigidaeris]RAI59444.1 hypothetical protein DOO78_07505 [Roseicella frigidaeris]
MDAAGGAGGGTVWYGERDGQVEGPFDEAALRARLRREAAAWRVWRFGMAGWREAAAVFGEAALAPGSPRAAPAGRRPGYLARHWRGLLGLGTSFWVNGILLNLTAAAGGLGLALGLSALQASAWQTALLASLILLLGIPVLVWQVVGTWRSARRHVGRGGRRVWALAAQATVALSFGSSLITLARESLPLVLANWVHAAQIARLPPPMAHSLRRGRELAFTGAIRPGAAAILGQALDAAPEARVLHLDSPGGAIAEAVAMAQMVWQRGLTTYVRGQCASACTIIFQAGRTRLLREGASLGFHRPSSLSSPAPLPDLAVQAERQRMLRSGQPAWFVDRVMETPPSQLWLPSDAELVRAGILTRRVDGEEFSPGRPPAPLRAEAMRARLRAEPLAAALERLDPAAFEALATAWLALAGDGATRGERAEALHRAVLPHYAAGLWTAPDAALLALAEAALPAMESLARRRSARCADWLHPPAGGSLPDVARLLLAAEWAALETAAVAVMEQADRPPETPALDPERVEALLREAQAAISVRLVAFQPLASGLSPLSGSGGPATEPAAPCRGAARLVREILRLPAPEAAPVLREALLRL